MNYINKLQQLKETLTVRRGSHSRYYMSIEFNGEVFGQGFDDARFWDALNDLDDKSLYNDAELTAVKTLILHHNLEVEILKSI